MRHILSLQPLEFSRNKVYNTPSTGRSGGMVDAADSKSATCEGVGVQVPPSVLQVLAARRERSFKGSYRRGSHTSSGRRLS